MILNIIKIQSCQNNQYKQFTLIQNKSNIMIAIVVKQPGALHWPVESPPPAPGPMHPPPRFK